MGQIASCCLSEGTNTVEIKKNSNSNASSASTTSSKEEDIKASSSMQKIILVEPAFTPGNFTLQYELQQMIGNGAAGVCHQCYHKQSRRIFACKIIDKKNTSILAQCQTEIQVLQALQHPHIIHLQDVFTNDRQIYMIMEIMQGGELFEYIVEKGTLSEKEASSIVRDVTSALAYMHARGIVHRDLKPENLLLTNKKKGARVKIIDFGLAKDLHDAETQSFLGTRGYLAPEILRRRAYSKAVDIWALGVIVYVLLCGCLPFDDDGAKIHTEEAAQAKFKLRFPRWASGLSAGAKDLLKNLLQVDATQRMTAEAALCHPWVIGREAPGKMLESPKYMQSRNTPNTKQRESGQVDSPLSVRRQSH